MHWDIAESLGLIPKDNQNFDLTQRGCLSDIGTPRGIFLNGNLEDIAPMTYFKCTKCH